MTVVPHVSQLRTLAIDFDGVVHAYGKGWHGGVIYDAPVEGCLEALRQLSKRYDLVLFTARHDLEAVHLWLVTHSMRHLFREITNRKPAAVRYVDDRAYEFRNWEQTLYDLIENKARPQLRKEDLL